MSIARIPHNKFPSSKEMTTTGMGVGRPILFQLTKVGSLEPLWPYILALHVNPTTLNEQFTKSKNTVMTRGGFVEFIWPDEFDSLSADGTTGAFIGPDSGLTSDSSNTNNKLRKGVGSLRHFRGRHGTMAWERHTDLLELFRSNGHVFNGSGVPVLKSSIICMYDRGVFNGHFLNFKVTESGDTPFQFKVNWEFKITSSIYILPSTYIEEPIEDIIDPATPGNTQEARDIEAEVNQATNDESWMSIFNKSGETGTETEIDDSVKAVLNTNIDPELASDFFKRNEERIRTINSPQPKTPPRRGRR